MLTKTKGEMNTERKEAIFNEELMIYSNMYKDYS